MTYYSSRVLAVAGRSGSISVMMAIDAGAKRFTDIVTATKLNEGRVGTLVCDLQRVELVRRGAEMDYRLSALGGFLLRTALDIDKEYYERIDATIAGASNETEAKGDRA